MWCVKITSGKNEKKNFQKIDVYLTNLFIENCEIHFIWSRWFDLMASHHLVKITLYCAVNDCHLESVMCLTFHDKNGPFHQWRHHWKRSRCFLEIFVIPNILPFIYLQEIIIHFETLSISNVSFLHFRYQKMTDSLHCLQMMTSLLHLCICITSIIWRQTRYVGMY